MIPKDIKDKDIKHDSDYLDDEELEQFIAALATSFTTDNAALASDSEESDLETESESESVESEAENKTISELEQFLDLTINLDKNVLKKTVELYYENLIKFKNGTAQKPNIEFIISLATDQNKNATLATDQNKNAALDIDSKNAALAMDSKNAALATDSKNAALATDSKNAALATDSKLLREKWLNSL